ncbi:uncharacterized protein EDB91DRAFT_1249937 [Suillus paluster]|uniref:uncharacterized protein n=1 Tax=Suillus paluster TaxID=48578 RepID=UPI001B8677A0|nr:uncharacterized protein EDB91DRAFT_1249937 [Suillus paluster]KAG1736633.1 hypothetical protein EDB91DRAFT_1249937 [Suillus paluster]
MEQTRWIVQGPSDFCVCPSTDTALTDVVNSGTGTLRNAQYHKNGATQVTQSTHQQHAEQVQLQPQPQHHLPRYPPEMYSSAYAPPRPVPNARYAMAPPASTLVLPILFSSLSNHTPSPPILTCMGFVHDPSVGSSGGSAVQQGKRRAVDAVDTQQNKRQRRLPPKEDPDFREVYVDRKIKYECQVPACGGAVLEAGSMHKHRELKTHQPDIALVLCDLCNTALTCGDAVTRHRGSAWCLANQAKLQNAISASSSVTSTLMALPTITVPEGPFTFRVPGPAMSSVPQQTLHISPAAQFTAPGPSSVTQWAPPLPGIWRTAQIATQHSPRPGPSSATQQAPPLPVICHDISLLPAKQSTALLPSPVTVIDCHLSSKFSDVYHNTTRHNLENRFRGCHDR